MTKTIDLTHQRGDTFSRILSLGNGLLASLFPEVWFTVRSAYPAAGVLDETGALSSVTLTGGGIVQTGYSEWTITVNNPDWPVGRLVYDVQIRSGAGQIFTITKGALRVFDDVTRSV